MSCLLFEGVKHPTICHVLLELQNTGEVGSDVRGTLIADSKSFRHVFGQPAKREHNIENVKVTNSAWDTNLISASGVSVSSAREISSFTIDSNILV